MHPTSTPSVHWSVLCSQGQGTLTPEKKLLLDGCHESDFQFGRVLGVGSFGRVSLAHHKDSGIVCAIKEISKHNILKKGQLDHIKEEKNILAQVNHPFFTRLWGTFQNENSLYLVLEFVPGGEFFTHLRTARRLSEPTARFYAAQIVVAFEHLHKQRIVYRDLKPENILLDVHGNVKITDFGFAKTIKRRTFTLCGTPEYLAPEIILNKGHGLAVDWWALDILIYECLAGKTPFYDEDPIHTYRKIIAGKHSFPKFFSANARDLIKKLLQGDLTRRLGTLAGGAADVKAHPWFRGIHWDAIAMRSIQAPIIPIVLSNDDTRNFDHYDKTSSSSSTSSSSLENKVPALTREEQLYFDGF